jgi:hypothetical protein
MTTRDHKQYKRDRRYPRESIQQQAAAARYKGLAAQLDTALKLLHDKGMRIDCLESVNESQRAEIAELTFEVKRLTELAEVQRGRIAELAADNADLRMARLAPL